ncbi:MAG TPA: hypothetical protein PK542_04005 [Treponemataceae bacterium]|nr:hypothetical protein [Treponemataceae bacterium]HPS43631.1 hypothetical protein [Treponemataceae bacterium]
MTPDEEQLFKILKDSLLPGQDGIKIRAFLAFNRDNPLVKIENVQNLKDKGFIDIKDDVLFPIETL